MVCLLIGWLRTNALSPQKGYPEWTKEEVISKNIKKKLREKDNNYKLF